MTKTQKRKLLDALWKEIELLKKSPALKDIIDDDLILSDGCEVEETYNYPSICINKRGQLFDGDDDPLCKKYFEEAAERNKLLPSDIRRIIEAIEA